MYKYIQRLYCSFTGHHRRRRRCSSCISSIINGRCIFRSWLNPSHIQVCLGWVLWLLFFKFWIRSECESETKFKTDSNDVGHGSFSIFSAFFPCRVYTRSVFRTQRPVCCWCSFFGHLLSRTHIIPFQFVLEWVEQSNTWAHVYTVAKYNDPFNFVYVFLHQVRVTITPGVDAENLLLKWRKKNLRKNVSMY